jgi:hypothetical protein
VTDEQPSTSKTTLTQKVGHWLLKDREAKEEDLARLMKYNILLSFLCLVSVAGAESLNFALMHWPL